MPVERIPPRHLESGRVDRWWRRCLTPLAGAIIVGCASTQTAPPDDAPPAIGPLPGANYLIHYVDNTGLRVRDTRIGMDSVLVPDVMQPHAARVSPSSNRVAVVLQSGARSNLIILHVPTGRTTTAHAGDTDGTYTFAWTRDGTALGVGYRAGASGSTPSQVFVVDTTGATRDVGCSVSNQFITWRSNGTAVVSDGDMLYTVNAGNCATIASLPMQGKTDFVFSPDGNRVAFQRVTGNQAGLYVSAHNGAGAQRMADPQFLPRNVRWAPDASKIAFEIRSRRYANVTNIAVRDLRSGSVQITDEERELGVPSDTNPCWSPSGRVLAHDRAYARSSGADAYTTRQKVVKTIRGGQEQIVFEELTRTVVGGGGPDDCIWPDDDHLMIRTSDGWHVANVTSGSSQPLPSRVRPLFVQVFN